MFLLLLAIKAAAAAAIVLGLSVLAERTTPRIAGIISGAPLGALITFYMLGLEKGTAFVVASVPHAIAGMSGVLVYVAAFHWVSLRVSRLSIAAGHFASLLAYLAAALTLERIAFTWETALPLTTVITIAVGYLFRRNEDIRVTNPARLTFGLLALRAGSAAMLVVTAVSLAKALGPSWAGVLIGFPLTLLPTMVIVQLTYSLGHVHAMLKGFPVGVGSVLTYLMVVPWSFTTLGVHLGSAVALAAAWSYLIGLTLFYRWRRRRH